MSLEAAILSYEDGLLYVQMDGLKAQDAFFASQDGARDIGAIYQARVDRVLKGAGGCFVNLGGETAFLRTKAHYSPGARIMVQIQQYANDDKPLRVSDQIDYRGINLVLTPGRVGANISRKAARRDLESLRDELAAILPEGCGMILRSQAALAAREDVYAEMERLLDMLGLVENTGHEVGLIVAAPTGALRAQMEWGAIGICEGDDATLDAVRCALVNPLPIAGGEAVIERTKAFIAVDVNTGANTAPSAARDVNMVLAGALPPWLHMRGWGGQVVMDLAPMPVNARKPFEARFVKSAREAGLGFVARGFGPLGLFEGVMRYARRELPASLLE